MGSNIRTLKYEIKWDEYNGMPITDIYFKHYDLVIEFMWKHSFMKSVVFEGMGLFEVKKMKEIYSSYVRHILLNETSVMMLSADETKIEAVGLLEWMTEDWHSWVYLPSCLPRSMFTQLIMLKMELVKQTKEQSDMDVYDALMIHELGFPDDLSYNRDFLMCMFDTFGAVAQHMHMPRVCFVALSTKEQAAANMAAFEEVGRTIYSIYKVGSERPFDILRELDEMYALMYELPLSPIVHYKELPGYELYHEALAAKEAKEAAERGN